MFWLGIVFSIVLVHGTHLKCHERLDVVSPSAWSLPPTTYNGRNLLDNAEIAAVRGDHAVLHTSDRETYLRGGSSRYHLKGDMTRELVEIRGEHVVDIQFGIEFIAIQTANGVISTSGSNVFGKLGHHSLENRPIFSSVDGLPPVKQIAVGDYHVVVLTRHGELISWGGNLYQQLGYPTNTVDNPNPKYISLGEGTSLPQFVCCGGYHCAALTDDLKVYTWGENGKNGRPSTATTGVVHGIPSNETIKKISCGRGHTLALTESGDLYGWGHNGYGEQLEAPSQTPYATKLDLDERIVRDVAAGPYMTIIRTYYSHGEYFGHYDGENYRTPQLATSVNHIRDVMANYYYGQDSWGTVLVRCPAADNEMP